MPLLPGTTDFAKQGAIPGGTYRNREFYSPRVIFSDNVPLHMQDILFDAQTSGGLLISVDAAKADRLLKKLHLAGIKDAAVIGEAVGEHRGRMVVV
jgi:selenide,water dikinase